jgi:hypothetical protein
MICAAAALTSFVSMSNLRNSAATSFKFTLQAAGAVGSSSGKLAEVLA